jgi:hypothetical protein
VLGEENIGNFQLVLPRKMVYALNLKAINQMKLKLPGGLIKNEQTNFVQEKDENAKSTFQFSH